MNWNEYKEMVDGVYYNQKTRRPELDRAHKLLETVGQLAEDSDFSGVQYVEIFCQKLKEVCFRAFDKKGCGDIHLPMFPQLIENTKLMKQIHGLIDWTYSNPQAMYSYLD